MAFQKILCPVDFSVGSQHAMAEAAQLARAYDSELVVLHAWSLPAVGFGAEYMYPAEVVQDLVNDAQRGLDAAIAGASKLGVRHVTGRLIDGPAGQTILDMVKADPAIELIVIGTHGRTGIRRVLLGSVAELVVRHAACPVLTLRPDNELKPFRQILCPVDFSPESRAAADLAGELAQADGKGISLLHVLEPPFALADVRPFDVDRQLSRLASAKLDEWAGRLAARVKVPVSSRVCVGRPGVELLAALDGDRAFDLVVMGHRGRSGARIVLGSIAEKVVRYAHCPVLITQAKRTPGADDTRA
jgi:nucleotide-binding universal stress UspA family protein